MNTPTLPTHIGGLQHLADDVIVKAYDVLVSNGVPVDFCHEWAGETVAQVEAGELCRVYRRIPVAKQGDNDDTGWKQVQAAAIIGGESAALDVARTGQALPTEAAKRKGVPVYSGFIKYFPLAIAAVARLSQVGNDQHNPGQPLHWDRSKSGDELDALMRHLMEADAVDTDGVPHIVKCCWRALAAAEKYLEKNGNEPA